MGSQFFGRSCRLTLGTTLIDLIDASQASLAMTFSVKKNLKPEPNVVEIAVWNLKSETRKSIEQPLVVPVKLEVGYGGQNFTIFLGELFSAHSERQEHDIITRISSGDKEKQMSSGRALVQVPAKATPAQLLSLAGQALVAQGVGIGNLQAMAGIATATTGGPARTINGPAWGTFLEVCRANGFEASVQDGALQILKIGANARGTAVRLSSDSGMVGSPTVDNKGILSVTSLIQPDLLPGLPVIVEGQFVQGAYRIEEVEFAGGTDEEQWYAHLKCRKWS